MCTVYRDLIYKSVQRRTTMVRDSLLFSVLIVVQRSVFRILYTNAMQQQATTAVAPEAADLALNMQRMVNSLASPSAE